jgi:type I restriction-modification system DNA methylase subunit
MLTKSRKPHSPAEKVPMHPEDFAAVLIFTKGGSTEKVWFYNMDADGYSLDDKRTSIDGKGDIPDIIQHFRNRKKENPINRKGKCFFVPISEIKKNAYDLYPALQRDRIRRSTVRKTGNNY